LDTCLKWLGYRLTVDNPRCFTLQWHLESLSFDRTFSVDRVSKSINNPSHDAFSNIDGSNTLGSFYSGTSFNFFERTEENHPDVIFLEVQNDPFQSVFKFNQLPVLCICQSVNVGDTVTYV